MRGQQFCLIETALPALAPVQGNGDHGIEGLIDRDRPFKTSRQPSGQRFHAAVFIKVNQTAEFAFVESKTRRAIEGSQPRTTSGTRPKLIKRVGIDLNGV